MSTSEENTIQSTTNEVGMPGSALFELDPIKQRFIQLYMTGNFTLAKISQLLEIHPNTAGKWLKRDDVQNAITEAQGEIQKQVQMQITANTMKAVSRLNTLMDSTIDAVALQAVKDVLDRGGHKPKNEIKVDKTVTTIEQRFKEIIDNTVDADFEEIEVIEVVED